MAMTLKSWYQRPSVQIVLIAVFVMLLGIASLLVPGRDIEIHNLLHHLNFLPLVIAGMLFGWRGAVVACVFSALVDAPVIAHHWKTWPLDAKDQIVELSVFSAAGIVAGYLSDQE